MMENTSLNQNIPTSFLPQPTFGRSDGLESQTRKMDVDHFQGPGKQFDGKDTHSAVCLHCFRYLLAKLL